MSVALLVILFAGTIALFYKPYGRPVYALLPIFQAQAVPEKLAAVAAGGMEATTVTPLGIRKFITSNLMDLWTVVRNEGLISMAVTAAGVMFGLLLLVVNGS
ncbi:hypothetical protein WCX18_06110 [Sulfurimonas sp. HSL1-2]|uniref:hypothetical protein n=1 Tax=Thiomicrolovo zhangzhouensis TaxID=3131933 RepID=UPI0031F733BA